MFGIYLMHIYYLANEGGEKTVFREGGDHYFALPQIYPRLTVSVKSWGPGLEQDRVLLSLGAQGLKAPYLIFKYYLFIIL